MAETNTIQFYRSQLQGAIALVLQNRTGTVSDLADLLYDGWYTPPADEPVLDVSPAELVANLRAADAFGSRFEAGWTVVDGQQAAELMGMAGSPWQVAVTRGTEMRWVDPVDFIYDDAVGLKPPAGAAVQVSQRIDSVYSLPGWWNSLSPAWPDKGNLPLVRLYWSIKAPGVCELVESLTSRLDPKVPYAIKCPLDMTRYRRPDGVTLYLATAAWRGAVGAIREAHKRNSDWLRHSTPAFTFRLAKGLALAEDPAQDSFGMARCKILAAGMWPVIKSGAGGDLLPAVERAIRSAGLRLDAPYLNPGSTAQYPW